MGLHTKVEVGEGNPPLTSYLVDDDESFTRFIHAVNSPDAVDIALDVETTGVKPYHGDKLIGISFYFPHCGEAFYITPEYIPNLTQHYPNHGQTYYLWNGKFDLTFLRLAGFRDPDEIVEVMVLAHQADETRRDGGKNYRLKDMAVEIFGNAARYGLDELEAALEAAGLEGSGTMWQLPAEQVYMYANYDTWLTWRLHEFFSPVMDRWNMWTGVEMRSEAILKMLLPMELQGFRLDIEKVNQHIEILTAEMSEIEKEFEEAAAEFAMREGCPLDPKLTQQWVAGKFNPRSPKQVKLFFKYIDSRDISATHKDMMIKLEANGSPWAGKKSRYSRLQKMVSSFYKPYLEHVAPDGRIHMSINPTGTKYSRYSSYQPNMQQAPRKDEALPANVKECLMPTEGRILVQTDYSQLELRLATHYATQDTMRELFNSGADPHEHTTNELNKVLTWKMSRHHGKTANFSFLYGMGPDTGALRLRLPLAQAKDVVYGWRELYPQFVAMKYKLEAQARTFRAAPNDRSGPKHFQYIQLPVTGRCRHYHMYKHYPRFKGKSQYHAAWNSWVQGMAGVIMEEALIRIARLDLPIWPIMTVHDSFIYEVDPENLAEVVPIVEHEMVRDWKFDPLLEVDTDISDKSWGDLEPYEMGS